MPSFANDLVVLTLGHNAIWSSQDYTKAFSGANNSNPLKAGSVNQRQRFLIFNGHAGASLTCTLVMMKFHEYLDSRLHIESKLIRLLPNDEIMSSLNIKKHRETGFVMTLSESPFSTPSELQSSTLLFCKSARGNFLIFLIPCLFVYLPSHHLLVISQKSRNCLEHLASSFAVFCF